MDEQERKKALIDDIQTLYESNGVETSPNFKFMLMMRSRLLEEDIPLEAVNTILSVIEFDFTELNEEDDFLGDVASEYAPVLKKVFDVFNRNGFEDLTPVKEHFNLMTLRLVDIIPVFDVPDEGLLGDTFKEDLKKGGYSDEEIEEIVNDDTLEEFPEKIPEDLEVVEGEIVE